MFNFTDHVITKVFNPLNVTKTSVMEFNIGELKDTGLYRFSKIIEFNVGGRNYTRYLIFSKPENTEYVFEVFPENHEQFETYLYNLADTVPFSEEFLEIVGQRYFTTPDGDEYERCVMSEDEERIDGIQGSIKVYNIGTNHVEKETPVKIWDYKRETDGGTKFLSVEMSEETGEFRIFIGEIIESIFYKFYQTSK